MLATIQWFTTQKLVTQRDHRFQLRKRLTSHVITPVLWRFQWRYPSLRFQWRYPILYSSMGIQSIRKCPTITWVYNALLFHTEIHTILQVRIYYPIIRKNQVKTCERVIWNKMRFFIQNYNRTQGFIFLLITTTTSLSTCIYLVNLKMCYRSLITNKAFNNTTLL